MPGKWVREEVESGNKLAYVIARMFPMAPLIRKAGYLVCWSCVIIGSWTYD